MNTEKSLLIAIRRWIGVSIIALVPLCLIFGAIGYHWSNDYGVWFQSISTTYWTSARNIFVGIIFMLSVFHFLYNGYNWMDKIVNLATGCCLLGLIFFPSYSNTLQANGFERYFEVFPFISEKVSDTIHMVCAIGVFIIQTINLAFLFTKQNGEMTDKKKQRNILYIVCAIIAVLLLAMNQITIILATHGHILSKCQGLIIQCLAFTDIGVAWLVKGEGIAVLNDR